MGLFGFGAKKKAKSKNVAKDRLKLVLVHDRVNVSPRYIELVKNDMIKVISNYMEIDEAGMEISVSSVERGPVGTTRLVADIPILGTKGRAR
ncbi:MAG: cell division topological specificity factor MinE [Christensenellales bacterium]|jgi:cell division topological specificity factor